MRTKTAECGVNWRDAGESLAIKAQTLLYALDGVVQLFELNAVPDPEAALVPLYELTVAIQDEARALATGGSR